MSADFPRRYILRPRWVEAMGPLSADNAMLIASWCRGYVSHDHLIVTLTAVDGTALCAEVGDYVVRDHEGHFSTMGPDVFGQTYRAFEPDASEQIMVGGQLIPPEDLQRVVER